MPTPERSNGSPSRRDLVFKIVRKIVAVGMRFCMNIVGILSDLARVPVLPVEHI